MGNRELIWSGRICNVVAHSSFNCVTNKVNKQVDKKLTILSSVKNQRTKKQVKNGIAKKM